MKNLFFVFIVTFLFTNCTAEYQSYSLIGGGYENIEHNPNKFSVTYYGNGYLSLQKADEYANRRALELCKEKGYSNFTVSNLNKRMIPYISGSEIACVYDSKGNYNCQDLGSEIQKPVVNVTFSCTSDPTRAISKI